MVIIFLQIYKTNTEKRKKKTKKRKRLSPWLMDNVYSLKSQPHSSWSAAVIVFIVFVVFLLYCVRQPL